MCFMGYFIGLLEAKKIKGGTVYRSMILLIFVEMNNPVTSLFRYTVQV